MVVLLMALLLDLVDRVLSFEGLARLLLVQGPLAVAALVDSLPAVFGAVGYQAQRRQEAKDAAAARAAAVGLAGVACVHLRLTLQAIHVLLLTFLQQLHIPVFEP